MELADINSQHPVVSLEFFSRHWKTATSQCSVPCGATRTLLTHSELQSPDCLTDPAHLAPWFYFSQSKNDESEPRIPVTILLLLEGDAPGEEQMICDIFTACIEYNSR